MDNLNADYTLFLEGRIAFELGHYELALSLFQQSLDYKTHFKTLEMLGDTLCHLGRHHEAIVPLTAATELNHGSRPHYLLAEAYFSLKDWANAKAAAEEALHRTPGYGRAKTILIKAERQIAGS